MFPKIEQLSDVLPFVENKKEFAIQRRDGLTNIFYLITDSDTFDHPINRECRGITFGPDNRIISRPLHKFYNLGEKPATQLANIDWSSDTHVMPKLDGSLGASFVLNGRIGLKTKGGHHSRQSIAMTDFVHKHTNYRDFVSGIISQDLTANFEFIAPQERIVVDNGGETSLTLLHVRDNITGQYLNVENLIRKYDIPTVVRSVVDPHTIEDYLNEKAKHTEEEGVVFQFDSGEMIKFKTEWYLRLHKLLSYRRERDIAKLVIASQLDDSKALLLANGFNIQPLEQVEAKVIGLFADLKGKVETIAEKIVTEDIDNRTAYERWGYLPYFKLVRAEITGREPDYLKYFSFHILKQQFSLEEVF